MNLPDRTTEEQAEHLAAAREAGLRTRRERKDLKDRLKRGELSLLEVLRMVDEDPGGVAGATKVKTALMSLPGVGEARAARLMQQVGIPESRLLRGLGPGQRQRLVDGDLLSQLADGRLSLPHVLRMVDDDPDGVAGEATVGEVVQALPGFREVRTVRLLRRLSIPGDRLLRDLSLSQRRFLLGSVG